MREPIIDTLRDVILGVRLDHPTRVGIDGRSAAGETSLANEIASAIVARGRPVLRAELDDFHRPGHKFRSINGQWTPASYYAETYDYTAIRTLCLSRWGEPELDGVALVSSTPITMSGCPRSGTALRRTPC